MDGGNSYYNDTTARSKALEAQGILYLGVGISGGEEGARKGPAIMPGGSKEAYALMAPFFDLVVAKDHNHKPCSAYMGPDGAGHFVKMVHNGIEYAEMQILAETYAVMRNLMGLAPQEIAQIMDQWKQDGEGSFLLEITRDIMLKKEGDDLLLDKIVDAAEQKGTGSWTIKASLELGIPINTITDAVTARVLSSMKAYRVKAHSQYTSVLNKEKKHEVTTETLKSAFKAARLINHITGFEMIKYASDEFNWGLNLAEIARVWTNGCIIRSVLMEQLSTLLTTERQLLLAPQVVKELSETQASLALVAAQSLQNGLAVPVYASALNYFLSCITANSAANLIQAQRDYFGAHRYKRVDQDQHLYFHTQWV
jgi:6-phosphogluconate dehydrogenase